MEQSKSGNLTYMLSTKLKAFIESQIGSKYAQHISDTTLLQDDLQIYGDDAADLIVAFAKEFNVDISQFNISLYFSPEGDIYLIPFLKKIFGFKTPKRKPLTMQHLQNAIDRGMLL